MRKSDKKRLNRIRDEFADGFSKLSEIRNGVVIFGSARKNIDDKYYKVTRDLAYKLSKEGFSIITGAGLGIMEAANKGAYEAGGVSVGLNIELPEFQAKNNYINHYICFKHFYTRKVFFSKYSIASVACPGGYGTIDEIFDQLAVLQNKKIPPRPVILLGKDFYSGLIDWIYFLRKEQRISEKDLELFKVTDDIDEVVNIIKEYKKAPRKFFI